MQCKCTGLTKYANVSAYIPTFTDLVSPGAYPDLVSPSYFFDIRSLICDQFTHLFVKKEFKAALMTSFILLLLWLCVHLTTWI